ncbi:hypothetical protein SPOG_02864 [Schizosaccharomyces cryophilus OY26]|uniref:Uncharacterized protein n=1 Tax=Schizosaccharomyces cryophilus (strain OY26 / ATCC MYA-4695 / CBS 11777 / NBRC 106824 / NRRL Y48691) TaxID=653667 RepID=S9W5U2_SCHCR|nr:uncharacterized protein SPOG_02864 [Schizosaccharomyces cryophilus OY26]EPY53914.1 hypothetical protein SPOG_02864 [Schizosaccharomyces cryophilus OY26]
MVISKENSCLKLTVQWVESRIVESRGVELYMYLYLFFRATLGVLESGGGAKLMITPHRRVVDSFRLIMMQFLPLLFTVVIDFSWLSLLLIWQAENMNCKQKSSNRGLHDMLPDPCYLKVDLKIISIALR